MTSTQVLRTLSVLTSAAFLVALVGVKPLYAIGAENPPPPSNPVTKQDKKKSSKPDQKKKKQQKKSDAEFLREYHTARALIVEGQYKAGIAAMHAIGHDEHPDVANYIGYAYRKLGDYNDSKVWYEKALAADPNHVRTWSYYGMWQMEQGNRLKALDDLQKVKLICGNTDCREYRELKAVIDGKASY
jgi:Tetratricopeptide repeat.